MYVCEHIRRLTQGSYEHSQARIREALSKSESLSGAVLIGTYPTHALLLRESGEVVKVSFQVNSQGVIVLGLQESVAKLAKAPPADVLAEARAILEDWSPQRVATLGRRSNPQ
jgi:outer membrane biosynthesis protein TonB